MPSPESLVRLRPWIFRLLVAALLGAGVLGVVAHSLPSTEGITGRAIVTLVFLGIGSICALNCISYTRRRERTGPALIGLVLIGAAVAGALAEIWLDPAVSWLDPFVKSCGISALLWTFILAVYSERLPVRWQIVQHVAASCITGLGLVSVIAAFTDDSQDVLDEVFGKLLLASLVSLLVVIALAHHYRSGVRALVPMAHVASVLRAMDFYKQLGFQCENSFSPPQAPEPTWAWMETPGGAQLMLVCAEEPVASAQQGVLFYVYCDDLPAKHSELAAKGLAVGPIEKPFYAPRGEFRLTDPDGYALMLTHT